MSEDITKYIHSFETLNRGYNKGLGKAPHKPVLLLSIIQLIKKKEIVSNRIFITPELLLEFKNIWDFMVDSPHIPNFALPFFHMRSEPFWHLVTKPGMELHVTKSKSIKSVTFILSPQRRLSFGCSSTALSWHNAANI